MTLRHDGLHGLGLGGQILDQAGGQFASGEETTRRAARASDSLLDLVIGVSP